jgi:serine/threonine-protein kinase SRPK3
LRGNEDDEDSDGHENDDKFYEHKPTYDPKLVDRSFTNLGYIGFGDGIDLEALDNTGNWQFENI